MFHFFENSTEALVSFKDSEVLDTIASRQIEEKHSHYHLVIGPALGPLPGLDMVGY
jgi:hypothetical protein